MTTNYRLLRFNDKKSGLSNSPSTIDRTFLSCLAGLENPAYRLSRKNSTQTMNLNLSRLLEFIKIWRKMQTNPSVPYQPIKQDLVEIKETLERVLTENIIPFWYPQVIDLEDGGYRLNHDFQGTWKGRANKRIVTQARTVWFFSRLFNSSYGSNKHLEAAKHGYEFLCERMWDKEFGGFYWEVDSSGNATEPHKHLYGQAFALQALSEYASASEDSRAAELAQGLFSLLEHNAHDVQHGGYQEFFRSDWGAAPEGVNYLNAHPTLS